jgi:hypothetical protein
VRKASFPKQNSSISSSRIFLAVEGRGEMGMGVYILEGEVGTCYGMKV